MKTVKSINLHEELILERPESHTVLDVDGVIANFAKGFLNQARKLGFGHKYPKTELEAEARGWNYGVSREEFEEVWKTVKYEKSFWLGLEAYPEALTQLRFNPLAYITHRPVDNIITQEWLSIKGFPCVERCYTVEKVEDKVSVAKSLGAKRIIDDRIATCQAFIDAGLDAYLFTRVEDINIFNLESISKLGELDYNGLKKAA